MKLLLLIQKLPALFLGLVLLSAVLLGSHAGLDLLAHQFVGSCVPLDASTKLCLVPMAD
jgi:hypothetical protein